MHLLTRELYVTKPADYYAAQLHNSVLRGSWFRRRQNIASALVRKYYKGGIILDIGCGNCLWKHDATPTIGIDICTQMLGFNRGRLASFFPLQADFSEGLPLKDESIDLIVLTEILEHMTSYSLLVSEVRRVLKKDGVAIISVPYGEFPGLWGRIFPLWCAYKGWRDKDEYYKHKCGHVVNFSPRKLKDTFGEFVQLEQKILGFLTIFFVVQKSDPTA